MEQLFEWNMEGDGERDLKALPYVVAWFDKAGEAVADDEEESVVVDVRKLSAIYQFAQEMPLLFVPVSQNIKDEKNGREMWACRLDLFHMHHKIPLDIYILIFRLFSF